MDKFWNLVEKTQGCWFWKGYSLPLPFNYGFIHIDGRRQYAHRLSWMLAFGQIPNTLKVLHKCDNPSCVRPDHLFLGTYADNNRDRDAKGRGSESWANLSRYLAAQEAKEFCSRGHPRTADNLYKQPGTNSRRCRICQSILHERFRRKHGIKKNYGVRNGCQKR